MQLQEGKMAKYDQVVATVTKDIQAYCDKHGRLPDFHVSPRELLLLQEARRDGVIITVALGDKVVQPQISGVNLNISTATPIIRHGVLVGYRQ
jgi:hypothetical protein